jgi:hypothetical protein
MQARLCLLLLSIGIIPATPQHDQTNVIARLPLTTRADIIARAKTFVGHTWTCGEPNLHAFCSKTYRSDWKPGQRITGIPYCWGAADSPEAFDKKIAKGLAAGAHSRNGVLSCAAGIDCSGFVCFCWGLPSHPYGTANLRTIAGKPRYNWFSDMKPGDALCKAGSHVVLFDSYNPDGTINVYEASGSAARVIFHKTTWSRFKGYIPLEYKAIDE